MKKTKNMIFYFTKKHKFTTRIIKDHMNIEMVSETKVLGTYITSDLKWDRNTRYLVRKAWMRMQLVHKIASFTNKTSDIKAVYMTFVRPVLEQSATVWHSSITRENSTDLERVQKCAVKLIMNKTDKTYKESLAFLGLTTLKDRREKLCMNFALRAKSNEKLKKMFPIRKELRNQKRRKTEKYVVQKAKTNRLKKTSQIYMQSLLNRLECQNKTYRSYQD